MLKFLMRKIASQGLEVMYVGDNDIDTLCVFEVHSRCGRLKRLKHRTVTVTAKMDRVVITSYLASTMNPTKYAGKYPYTGSVWKVSPALQSLKARV